jgi:hypothetical protein
MQNNYAQRQLIPLRPKSLHLFGRRVPASLNGEDLPRRAEKVCLLPVHLAKCRIPVCLLLTFALSLYADIDFLKL